MSLSFKERKRPTDAEIKDYYKLLQADPRSRIFAPLAEALAQRDMLDDAIKICEHGMKYHQDFSDGHITFARVLHLANQKDEALEHIRRALALDNRNTDAYLAAAEIFMEMNLIKAACEACLRIMEMEPQNQLANELLTRINNRSHAPETQKPQEFQSTNGTVPSQRRKADPVLSGALQGLFEELEEEGSQKIEQNENPFRALSSGSQSGHPDQAADDFLAEERFEEETREVEAKLRHMIDQVRPKIEQPTSPPASTSDDRRAKTQPQINQHNSAENPIQQGIEQAPGRDFKPAQTGLQKIAYVQNVIDQYSADQTTQGEDLDLACLRRTRSIASALGMIGILVGMVLLMIALSSGTVKQTANVLPQTAESDLQATQTPADQTPAKVEEPLPQSNLVPESLNQEGPQPNEPTAPHVDDQEKAKKRTNTRRVRRKGKKNQAKRRLRKRKKR